MQTQQTFSLGAIKQAAPELPLPLDPSEFHTRQDIRDHQNAQLAYYDFQRDIEYQIKVAADLTRAKELAEANREQTDDEYDEMKRKQWQTEKDKQAARLQKEKDDAMEKTAYLLSSPALADLMHRSEFAFLKDFEYWVGQRGYTLGDEGLITFQPGFYHLQLTAPAAAPQKKAAK